VAALANRRHERVAQALAAMKSAEESSVEAGYPKTSSFAANARKRATYPEIKARVKELQSQAAACMVIDAAWLRGKVARMAGYEVPISHMKASDVIAACALLAKMLPEALVPQKVAPTNPEGDAPYDPLEINDEQRIAAIEAFIARVKVKTGAA
jgi:hypothetical protein